MLYSIFLLLQYPSPIILLIEKFNNFCQNYCVRCLLSSMLQQIRVRSARDLLFFLFYSISLPQLQLRSWSLCKSFLWLNTKIHSSKYQFPKLMIELWTAVISLEKLGKKDHSIHKICQWLTLSLCKGFEHNKTLCCQCRRIKLTILKEIPIEMSTYCQECDLEVHCDYHKICRELHYCHCSNAHWGLVVCKSALPPILGIWRNIAELLQCTSSSCWTQVSND